MIGWYVHDHGRGHVQRAHCIVPLLSTPVTVLSSLARPEGFVGGWLRLVTDRPTGDDSEVTAGGTQHWVPLHHPGLRRRMGAIAAWVACSQPTLMVVDVSVEVAVLVRSMGVPIVLVAMRGERTDRAHRTAYDLATMLLAPWPAELAEPWPEAWLAKTWHVGALSRHDGQVAVPPPGTGQVTVLWGQGGSEVSVLDVEASAVASPGWTWSVAGVGATWHEDTWSLLQHTDVVVIQAGQNVVAEVAAARRPAVVIPQPRPYGEQEATAAVLDRARLAVVRPTWPSPKCWPELLERAQRLGGGSWNRWSDGGGAARAAALLDEAASCGPQ